MTSSNNSFSGIWGETTPEMVEVADSLSVEHKEKPVNLRRKTQRKAFGIFSVMSTLVFFALLSLGVTAVYSTLTGERDLIKLASDPAYIVLSMVSMHFSWVLGAWVSVKAPTVKRFFVRLKFKFKRIDPLLGLGYAALFFGFASALSWFLTGVMGLDVEGAENTSTFTQFEGLWLIIFAYGFVSIAGPIVEELFFRGFMMQGIVNSLSRIANPRRLRRTVQVVSLLITATVFGFFHIQTDAGDVWWVTVVVTGMLGLFMGAISLIHKRLGPAVFAHIFYNCTAITIAILSTSS